jgi:DNA invertase Pin-like site-specific DNA recombinase
MEAQRAAVTAFLNSGPWELVDEFVEVESGRRDNRPELRKALALCKQHGATLIVARIDRLTRSWSFMGRLMASKVKFLAADMPNASEFEWQIRAALAQEEHRLISERTKAGLGAARAKGKRFGCPIAAEASVKGNAVKKQLAAERRRPLVPIIQGLREGSGRSYADVAQALNAGAVPTPGGRGRWHATTICRVMRKEKGRLEGPAA